MIDATLRQAQGAAQARIEATGGAALTATPLWMQWLHAYVDPVASTIACVCGAIVGLHAVWRLWKRRRASRP